MGQRHVLSCSVSISMSWSLNSSPILTSGHTNAIDSIHNTFIMCWGSIDIFSSELICFNNFSGNITAFITLSAHHLCRNFKPSNGLSLGTVVWQNGNSSYQAHFHNFDLQSFAKSVHNICTHRITDVHNNINDILFWVDTVQLSHSDVWNPSAPFHHLNTHAVQAIDQFLFLYQNFVNLLRFAWRNVDLSDHDAGSWWGKEWERSQEFSDWTASGHNWWLLNAHGNHKFLFVDDELRNYRKRQRKHSNHIFSHCISNTELQSSCSKIVNLDFRVYFAVNELNSIQNGHFVKFLPIYWHFFVKTFDSFQVLFGWNLVSCHVDMSASDFISSSPFIVNFWEIIHILIELVKFDFNFTKIISIIFLSLKHDLIIFDGINFNSIIKLFLN